MTWLCILLAIVGLLVLVALTYWQLIIAEGAYLGPHVVAWTYDWFASRYDDVKQFNPRDESWFIAGPLLSALQGVSCPLVLDVATGTGRLPLALFRQHFGGQIIGLDLSRRMLRQARSKLRLYGGQMCLIRLDASRPRGRSTPSAPTPLPFEDGTFDAVTCLEALEFLPRPLEALAEMVRVLAPGGVLFITNRVGSEARLLPGRAIPRPLFEQALASQPLRDVHVRRWQADYDLAMARKDGHGDSEGRGGVDLSSVLRCAGCGGQLQRGVARLSCPVCERTYPIREGIYECRPGGR